jgi:hypothetical protein
MTNLSNTPQPIERQRSFTVHGLVSPNSPPRSFVWARSAVFSFPVIAGLRPGNPEGGPRRAPAWITGSRPVMTGCGRGAPFHGLVSPDSAKPAVPPLCMSSFPRKKGRDVSPQRHRGHRETPQRDSSARLARYLLYLCVSVPLWCLSPWFRLCMGSFLRKRITPESAPHRHPGKAAKPRRSGFHLAGAKMDPGSRLRLGRDDEWGRPFMGSFRRIP